MAISTAIDASAVARVLGIKTIFKDLRGQSVVYLPQRVCVFGQGNSAATYATDKTQVTSAIGAAELYGYGSPVHLAVQKLLPSNGDGVGTIPVTVFPLEDAPGSATAAGSITPSGTATASAEVKVSFGEIDAQSFAITKGDSIATIVTNMAAAVNAETDVPVIATDGTTKVDIAAKWAGPTGNDIVIKIDGGEDSGITFVTAQPTGGLINPDVDDQLANLGNVWETLIINCLNIDDTDTLDKYETVGVGRWGATTRKPVTVWTGNTIADPTAASVVADSRKTDYINGQLVAPGSDELPFVVAARQIARIAPVANNNPPRDYGSRVADGIEPGADSDQWDYTQRNLAVGRGSSTIEVKDSEVALSDIVTFYHPTGDVTPAYRYLVDIVKVSNILFNLDLIFATEEWDGAPLIPDDQATTNRTAKKPKMAVAAVCGLIDNLALDAILSDPDFAKENTAAEIDSANPKRLNISSTMKISGNTNILSMDFNWGFYFGTSAVVA